MITFLFLVKKIINLFNQKSKYIYYYKAIIKIKSKQQISKSDEKHKFQIKEKKMELLSQATELSKKGQIYEKQGNYDYAATCYKKVIMILQGVILSIPTDKLKVGQLKNKVTKYTQKMTEMLMKQKQKNTKLLQPMKLSKLGFPKEKVDPIHVQFIKNIKPQIKNVKQQITLNTNNNFTKDQSKKIIQPKLNRNSVNVNNQLKNYNQNRNLKDIEPDIKNLIIHSNLKFKDIVGMEDLKKTLEQAIIRPRLRPDLYTGIRSPPRGLLLYGPPGNGKTYICKALANQSGCTFFALSASSIMNKLVGQTQKMLKKIFEAANNLSPSIIFIDQIDSILTARSENEHQASRRLKTQFLVLLDGVNSPKSGQIIVIGATNLPKQLDLAARRRFNKLIYVGMPDKLTRQELLLKNLQEVRSKLSKDEIKQIGKRLQGYSASQIANIVKQVCMLPLREISNSHFQTIDNKNIREVNFKDFIKTIKQMPPLLSKQDLQKYEMKV